MINLVKKLICKIGWHRRILNNWPPYLKKRLGELEDIVDMDLFPWCWPDTRTDAGVKDFEELMRRYGAHKMEIHRAYFNKYGRKDLVAFLNSKHEKPSKDFKKWCYNNGVHYSQGFFDGKYDEQKDDE